jgi:hypothetical protein
MVEGSWKGKSLKLVKVGDLQRMLDMLGNIRIAVKNECEKVEKPYFVLDRFKDEIGFAVEDIERMQEFLHKLIYEFSYRGIDDRKFNDIVLKRDDYKCQFCGSEKRIEVHHIVPESLLDIEGGLNDPANGIALCGKCNGKLTSKRIMKFIFFNRCWCKALRKRKFGSIFFGARDYAGNGNYGWKSVQYDERRGVLKIKDR